MSCVTLNGILRHDRFHHGNLSHLMPVRLGVASLQGVLTAEALLGLDRPPRYPRPPGEPTSGSGPDGPVVPHASVHAAHGGGVAAWLVGDHSTAVAKSYASPV